MFNFGATTYLFFLFLALLSITTASNVDAALQRRQIIGALSTGASSTPTPTSSGSFSATSGSSASPSPSTISPSSSVSTTVTSLSTSSSDSTSMTPSSEPSSTSQPSSTNSQSSLSSTSGSPTGVVASTDPQSSAFSKPTVSVSTSVSSRTQQIVTTVVTVSGSNTLTYVSTTTGLVAVSTSSTTSTSAPTLDGSNGSSGSSGLQPSQRRIIIGVVVGIGGAILLGGLAVVAWKIWGRRRHNADEDNDLMDSHLGSSGLEKRSSVSGTSPFRSNLEQYHNPAGPVNTASNF